ncbi:immunoglobulin-binding protein 1 isoform X2 [Latimeria chalumnae]|uniref:immunoglobulin-binding protein 1 isoform X2 n=1 Tax=Latimeria chalumnae TaxID=7897 RepID=UPI0003C11C11
MRLASTLVQRCCSKSFTPSLTSACHCCLSVARVSQEPTSMLHFFSSNEELEEIATADLKFLLLPALLGALTLKEVNPAKRLEQVQKARVYFTDFLKRCKDYNVTKFELPQSKEEGPSREAEESHSASVSPLLSQSSLVAMAKHRQSKIERYKQKKDLENRLTAIRAAVDSGQADEETVRDFYLLNIRKWISTCLEEIESIDQEIEILKNMEAMKMHAASQRPPRQARPPMKPFILTRDAVQAQVLGAGYPSLPTMTVNDWYEEHRKRGALPDQGVPQRTAADVDREEQENEERERRLENDDEEMLRKARDWDNWKDTHRRGYGNRKNMG